jgi:hypothetical protein
MQEFVLPLMKAFGKLQQSTAMIAQKGLKNPDEAGAASSDYLRQFALVVLGYMWCKIVKAAQARLTDGVGDKAFYESKLKTARFFFARMLPEAEGRARMVLAGADTLMAPAESEF